jgi:hypothetical protein
MYFISYRPSHFSGKNKKVNILLQKHRRNNIKSAQGKPYPTWTGKDQSPFLLIGGIIFYEKTTSHGH